MLPSEHRTNQIPRHPAFLADNQGRGEVKDLVASKHNATVYVVIPAYNEEATIGAVVGELLNRPNRKVVVVNDSSEDTTGEAARSAGATVLNAPFRMGAWSCMQTGMRWALRHGATIVVTMDADGQHRPEDIDTLVLPILAGTSDMVIGSCTDRGSTARKVAWWYLRLIGGVQHKDITSGFRVYNQTALKVVTRKHLVLLDYQDVGVLMALAGNGASVSELAITMHCRTQGKSRIFSSWLKVFEYMLLSTILTASKRGQKSAA